MKTRKLSIKARIIILIAIVGFACLVVSNVIAYNYTGKIMLSLMKEDAIGLAKVAAAEIDGAVFENITDDECEEYSIVYDSLSKYKLSGTIQYIYAMKQTGEEQLAFVVDTDTEDPADCMEPYDEWLEGIEIALGGEAAADEEITADEWGEYFSAYAPVMNDSRVVGVVGCDIGISTINEKLSSLKALFIILIVVFDIVFIGAAYFIGTYLGRNLNKLFSKVKDLNTGDGDLTRRVSITSGDELELIADQFNTFTDSIRNVISNVANASEIVSSNSSDMNNSMTGCRENISDISISLQTLSAGMEESSASINLMLDNMMKQTDEIGEACERTTVAAKEADSISQEALAKKKQILVQSENASALADQLRITLEETIKKCEGIYEIEALASKILKVSSTTQILSLNANIEAARAGESGRGFAIIAKDIEELSKQISVLATQINNTNSAAIKSVEELIENTRTTATFINDNVIEDYKNFEQVGSEYSTNMEHMAAVLIDVSAALADVSTKISDMQLNVGEMDKVITDSAISVSEVAGNSAALSDHMDELSHKAELSNSEAENMTESISQYKY